MLKKALFLDRDGVINHDPGDYTKSLSEFILLEGVIEAMKSWVDAGYEIIVITNQGGLDKGLYPRENVEAMHQYLQGKCITSGFEILDFYYCPHHHEYSGKCLCRKPGSLMIERAMHKHGIDPNQSLMFGDKQRDIDAAEKAGVKGMIVEINKGVPVFQSFDFIN
jgi:D-glycero-D-manno-heptose 1,7-bisphosphate phosphatase